MLKVNFSTYVAHFVVGLVLALIGAKQVITGNAHSLFLGEFHGKSVLVSGVSSLVFGLLLVSMPFVFKRRRKDSELWVDFGAIAVIYFLLELLPVVIQ